MSIKIITSIDEGGGGKEGKGGGGGEGDLTYRQRSRKLVLQNTPTRNLFKNRFIGTTLGEPMCYHGNSSGFCTCVQ